VVADTASTESRSTEQIARETAERVAQDMLGIVQRRLDVLERETKRARKAATQAAERAASLVTFAAGAGAKALKVPGVPDKKSKKGKKK
jgi:hypothetical protein